MLHFSHTDLDQNNHIAGLKFLYRKWTGSSLKKLFEDWNVVRNESISGKRCRTENYALFYTEAMIKLYGHQDGYVDKGTCIWIQGPEFDPQDHMVKKRENYTSNCPLNSIHAHTQPTSRHVHTPQAAHKTTLNIMRKGSSTIPCPSINSSWVSAMSFHLPWSIWFCISSSEIDVPSKNLRG